MNRRVAWLAVLAAGGLLTAAGIPQILAGDEFADQHDLFDQNGNVTQGGGKQVDPVNYSRLNQDWRARIKDCAARLIKFRTTSEALAFNDTPNSSMSTWTESKSSPGYAGGQAPISSLW